MRRKSGSTNIEFVLYMSLLIMLGMLVFSLAAAGSGAYAKLTDQKERDGHLRVALSYLELEVRRHDATGQVRIGTNPFGEGPALFLLDEYDGVLYEKLVFCQGGSLFEILTEQGADRTLEMAAAVASIDRIMIESVAKGIHVEVWKDPSGARVGGSGEIGLEGFFHLRSSEGMESP